MYLIIILGLVLANLTATQASYDVSDFYENIESRTSCDDNENEENHGELEDSDQLFFSFSVLVKDNFFQILISKPQILNVLNEQEVYIKYLKPPQLHS